jgi:phage shock protein A
MYTRWNQMEEEVAVLQVQLESAKAWADDISNQIEAYNKLIADLETTLEQLAARASADDGDDDT